MHALEQDLHVTPWAVSKIDKLQISEVYIQAFEKDWSEKLYMNNTPKLPSKRYPQHMPLFHSIVIFCHKSYNIVNEHINKNFFENLSTSTVPVIGIPEKPCLAFASTTSPTVWQGPRTKGSLMKPCSNFFTRFTSLT